MLRQRAHIEPATQWKDIYANLEKRDYAVVGARSAEVDASNFLRGGGNTYYTGRYGFACDDVIAY